MSGKNGPQVNFYAEGSYSVQTPGKQNAELIQKTDYPVSGKISLQVKLQKPEDMTLAVRIPQWSKESVLTVNGESVKVTPGENVNIKRLWKSGDAVEMNLDMRGRLVSLGELPKNYAIMRGPVVLTRDERLSGPSIETNIAPVNHKNGYIALEPSDSKNPEVWMAFKVSFLAESYMEGGSKPEPVELCDYSSAGNSHEGHPHFKVWLPQLVDPREMK